MVDASCVLADKHSPNHGKDKGYPNQAFLHNVAKTGISAVTQEFRDITAFNESGFEFVANNEDTPFSLLTEGVAQVLEPAGEQVGHTGNDKPSGRDG